MKFIYAIFAPALVAIVVRIIAFLAGIILAICAELISLLGIIENIPREFDHFCKGLALFETFVWDESWFYWGAVVVVTFFIECIIFSED